MRSPSSCPPRSGIWRTPRTAGTSSTARAAFAHRGEQWADRVQTNRAVAYRVHEDVDRGRWYLTASWTIPPARTVPLEAARTQGLVGVDTNADHLAACRLDAHGNPLGAPLRFGYDLTGTTAHRDAQIRHALIRLLHWAQRHHLAIAVEDLDFAGEKTREKYGRDKRFRKADLRPAHLPAAGPAGVDGGRTRHSRVAVDPAYTSQWGTQH